MLAVSVIIPVYNTEKYLSKCLDSVCNQTLSDIEIICINDCSSDNSLKILEDYAASDKRIKLINLDKNYGVSYTRNTGIDKAIGEYIAFVDSDDFLASDFLEKLYQKAKLSDAEVVKGNIYNYEAGNNCTYLSDFYDMNAKIEQNSAYFYYGFTSAIYRTKFIKENNILFPLDINYFEDPYFSISVITKNPKIEIESNAIYYYLQNSNSASTDCSLKSLADLEKSAVKIMECVNSNELNAEKYNIIFKFLYDFIYGWYDDAKLGDRINYIALKILNRIIAMNKINAKEIIKDLKNKVEQKEQNNQIHKKNAVKMLLKKYSNVYKKNTLKILVSYIKPSELFKTDILIPIHLGRAVAKEVSKDGVITDEDFQWLMNNCIGDDDFEGNISKENRKLGFLTGTYWAYKNYEKLGNPEYFGSFGYRKLLFPEFLMNLEKYDCVFPQKFSFGYTNKEYFINAHGEKIYNKTLEILKKLHNSDIEKFEEYMNLSEEYLLEMYIMKKEIFFDFCEWIFPIAFELLKTDDKELIPDNRADIISFFESENIKQDCNNENFDIYQKRIRAFMIERLTGYYLYKLAQNGVKYIEQDVFQLHSYIGHKTVMRLLKSEIRGRYV